MLQTHASIVGAYVCAHKTTTPTHGFTINKCESGRVWLRRLQLVRVPMTCGANGRLLQYIIMPVNTKFFSDVFPHFRSGRRAAAQCAP